jgi:hypothetical protein
VPPMTMPIPNKYAISSSKRPQTWRGLAPSARRCRSPEYGVQLRKRRNTLLSVVQLYRAAAGSSDRFSRRAELSQYVWIDRISGLRKKRMTPAVACALEVRNTRIRVT